MSFLKSLLALVLVVAFAGCASTSPSSSVDQNSGRTLTTAAGTRWVLAHWTSADGEKPALLPPAPTLLIGSEGRISGQSGVNNYTGTARISGAQLNWGANLAVTRRAGPPDLMASEARYLNDLQATRNVTIRGNRLIFTGAKPLRLEFTRAQP